MKDRSGFWFGAIIVALVLCALAQPAYLLIAWYFKIAPSVMSTANELTPVLGTVFTAGGLIVALVSIYSLVNIESATQKAVDEKVPQQIDSRIRSYLAANALLIRAQNLLANNDFTRLADADELVTEAANKESDIPGLYSWMGNSYLSVGANLFCRSHQIWLRFNDATGNMRLPRMEEYQLIITKALGWLEKGFQHNDGDHDTVALLIAEVHALLGDFPGTVRWLKKIGSPSRLTLNSFDKFFLANACKDDRALGQVGDLVGQSFTMSKADVKILMQSSDHAKGVGLIMKRKTNALPTPPPDPAIVGITFDPLTGLSFASWQAYNPEGRPYSGNTTYPENSGQDQTRRTDLDALLTFLDGTFYFVSPWEPT